MKLLVYAPKITNRVGYTFNLIFNTILGVDFEITINKNIFIQHQGVKICYNDSPLSKDGIFVQRNNLLFEYTIKDIDTQYFKFNTQDFGFENKVLSALFPTEGNNSDIPFDIFSATFYLTSRYEEYLCEREQFLCTDSVAYKNNFLSTPVVNQWAWFFAKIIKQKCPTFEASKAYFHYVSTINIERAFCYKNIGFFRTLDGYISDITNHKSCKKRTRVLLRKQPDPYDNYDDILNIADNQRCKCLFLCSTSNFSEYDDNVAYNNKELCTLLKHLADQGKVGQYYSFLSFSDIETMKKETDRLAKIIHKPIVRSRFCKSNFQLPIAYQNLITLGLERDYSMCYDDEKYWGFRSGICTPYNFFDLRNDTETNLSIQPIPYSTKLLRQTDVQAQEIFEIIKHLIEKVYDVDGKFILNWDIESFAQGETWKKMYNDLLHYCKTLKYENNKTKIIC